MHIRTAALGACLLVGLTACSGATTSPDVPRSAPSSKAVLPSPTPSTAAIPLQLGQETTWGGGTLGPASGTTVVLTYQQPVKGVEPPGEGLGVENGVWAAVDVKVCNRQGPDIMSDQQPWSLAFPDGTRIQVTGLNGGDLPKPEYPTMPTLVKAGDCLRGKIPFPVPKDQRPSKVIYHPASAPMATEWAVPAQDGSG